MGQQPNGRGSSARRSESGATTVEFALVSVVFLMFLYGIITYGVVFMVKHDMAHAAAQGARAGLGATGTQTPQSRANAAVTAAIAAMPPTFGANLIRTVPAPAPCLHDASVDCITVTLTYPYKLYPVIPALPFISAAIPDTLTATSVVALS